MVVGRGTVEEGSVNELLPELWLLGAGLLRKADMFGERNIIPFESCMKGMGPPGVKPET